MQKFTKFLDDVARSSLLLTRTARSWYEGRRSLWDRGDMDMPPPIFMKGDIHGNVPPNILEVMLFRMLARVTATVVCCILMQILCVVSQKSFSFWETSVPQTSSLPLCPPNNPVRSTPLALGNKNTFTANQPNFYDSYKNVIFCFLDVILPSKMTFTWYIILKLSNGFK